NLPLSLKIECLSIPPLSDQYYSTPVQCGGHAARANINILEQSQNNPLITGLYERLKSTPRPQFNRPRNILLPDHTPIELLPPHWTGPSHPKIFKYGRFVGPTSSGTSSGEVRLAVTSPYRPEFSSPAADLRTLLAKTESAGAAYLQRKQKLPAFFLICIITTGNF
ncbi:hypothetical protein TNCV_3033051, partial [Trichonephila clavipes]